MSNKKLIEDVSITKQKRKGKTLIQNLFEKLSNEYGEFPDEKMMIGELLKIEDVEYDSLMAN
jgi:hypothetical protein